MRISVEGNMGAGKSTFLKYFEEESKIKLPHLELDFSPEPVSKWSSLGSGNEDLLKPGIRRRKYDSKKFPKRSLNKAKV